MIVFSLRLLSQTPLEEQLAAKRKGYCKAELDTRPCQLQENLDYCSPGKEEASFPRGEVFCKNHEV